MKHLYGIMYLFLAGVAVLSIHKLSPTDMAGLGMDLVVYVIAVLVGVILVAKSIMKVRKGNSSSYIPFFINAMGLLIVTVAVYFVLTKRN